MESVNQLLFDWGSSDGGPPSAGYQLVPDAGGFLIYWDHLEVVRIFNERFALMVLGVLEEMGDPRAWRGVFSSDLQRRINRLYLAVPCPCNGAGPCVRPSGHPTTNEEPHEERRQRFDEWLTS
jgi:hypothetical protein